MHGRPAGVANLHRLDPHWLLGHTGAAVAVLAEGRRVVETKDVRPIGDPGPLGRRRSRGRAAAAALCLEADDVLVEGLGLVDVSDNVDEVSCADYGASRGRLGAKYGRLPGRQAEQTRRTH